MQGDLAKGWTLYRHRDFTGGENRIIIPERVLPNQLLKARNCTFTGDGILQSRLGKTLVNTAPLDDPITSVHRYVQEDGTGYLLVQSGTTLTAVEWDGSETLADLTTGAVTKTVNAAKLRSVVWKDKIILTNGVDDPFAFDGAAFANLGGTPPKSNSIAVYASKLFLVDVANPNFIRFSALEDPDTWDALDVINVRSGDGDTIQALSPLVGGLMIFKKHSTWVLYGFDRFDMALSTSPLHPAVGAYSHDAVVDGGIVFAGDNLYGFSTTEVSPLSITHKDVFSAMTEAQKSVVFAEITATNGRAMFHIGGEILNVETRYSGVLSWDNLNASCFASCNGVGDDGSLLVGDATAGNIYKMSNGVDDDGTEINTEIWDSYRDYEVVRKKVWRKCSPEFETFVTPTKAIYYSYDIDFGSSSGADGVQNFDTGLHLIWGTGHWGINYWSNGFLFNPNFFFTARGNRISFRVKTGQRVRYLGYVTKFREAGYI